jgi:neutral/alkaline ceramidase-like enzyme
MANRRLIFLLGVMLVVGLTGRGWPQEGAASGWRIGLATARITPDKPIRMAGYSDRTQPSQSVSSDLYAKAMALEDRNANRALLITADIIGFTDRLSSPVCKRLETSTGLERKSILLNAAHNHCGPVILADPSLVEEDLDHPFGDVQWKRLVDYNKKLEDDLVRIGEEALKDLKPARLSWGGGIANFVMNRREFTERGIILGVNPRGPVDRTVPVLRVEAPDGRLRGVLFGAACHCTTLGQDYVSIDGEYAGYAQSYLEHKFPGVQAMFITGLAGDANPYPRRTLALAQQHGRSLGVEVERVLREKLKPVNGPIRTELRLLDLPLQNLTRQEIEALQASEDQDFFAKNALKMLAKGKALPERYTAPFGLWQFGKDLTLVAYSGEPVVDYVALTEKALGPLNLWMAGYCNDVYGYLPSERILAEGGYETRGLYVAIGLFASQVQSSVLKAITEMAVGAGRPMPAKSGP